MFTLLKRGYNWNKSFDYRAIGEDYSLNARAEKEEKTNSQTSIRPLLKRIKISKSALLVWWQSGVTSSSAQKRSLPDTASWAEAMVLPGRNPWAVPGELSPGSERTPGRLQQATLPSRPSPPHLMLLQSFLLTPGWMTDKYHLLKVDLQNSIYPPTPTSFTWNEVKLTLLLYNIFVQTCECPAGTERDKPFFLHIIKLSAVKKKNKKSASATVPIHGFKDLCSCKLKYAGTHAGWTCWKTYLLDKIAPARKSQY